MIRNAVLFCVLIALMRSAHSSPSLDQCFRHSSSKYHIDMVVLKAIAVQESSMNSNAINARSFDEDVGLMQINTFWFDRLKDFGITRKDLFEPCTSIEVGAWVLAQSIQYFGNNWRAVGAYNAGTGRTIKAEKNREKYAVAVKRHYDRLLRRMREHKPSAPRDSKCTQCPRKSKDQ